jgi:hypothetical protein
MTPKELVEGTKEVTKDFYQKSNVVKRIVKSMRRGSYPFLWTILRNLSSESYYSFVY